MFYFEEMVGNCRLEKVWSIGDGHGLKPQQVGEFRVSTLNCWENWVKK